MCDIGQDKQCVTLAKTSPTCPALRRFTLLTLPLSCLVCPCHTFLLPLMYSSCLLRLRMLGTCWNYRRSVTFCWLIQGAKDTPLLGVKSAHNPSIFCSQPVHLLLTTRPSSASSASSGHSISSQWMELLGALDCRSCNSLRCCVTPRTILSEARRQTISRCVCAKAWCVQMWRARVR